MRALLIILQIFCISVVTPKRFIVKTNHQRPYGRKLDGPGSSGDDKIAGGWYVSSIKEHPYMVSVMVHKSHQCGGCLLSMSLVTTACHCVAQLWRDEDCYAKPLDYLKLYAFSFVAGTINIEKYDENGQVGRAKSMHFHPECQNKKSLVYDHAVAILREPFFHTPFVQPVKMFTWDGKEFRRIFLETVGGDNQPDCVVSGWGDARQGAFPEGIASTRLKALRMSVMREEDCSALWSALVPEQFLNFSFWEYGEICVLSVGTEGQGESDCGGDSGSPYVCDGKLVATVSYGTEDCGSGEPSVYATIAELLEWINKDFPDLVKEAKRSVPRHRVQVNSSTSPKLVPKPQREGRSSSKNVNSDEHGGAKSQNLTPALTVLSIMTWAHQ